MSFKFSGPLQLTELDDFISPSQECIKPVEIKKTTIGTGSKIKIQNDGAFIEHGNTGVITKLEKVEVSLNDCLACSGCITSAESVLISQQNHQQVLQTLKENKILKDSGASNCKVIVISISIQPILSLSEKYGSTPDVMIKQLTTYFKMLGADKVIDLRIADDFSLLEEQREFVERFRSQSGSKKIPMLSSSCPGWICYAEKTHGNFILPYLSTTKSPQQIIGSLVKYNMDCSPNDVYHVSIMPCYDKKLEASRNEFFNSQNGTKDVDCVITPIELEQMLHEENINLNELPGTSLDFPFGVSNDVGDILTVNDGSGSGGYAHHVLMYSAKELFGVDYLEMNWRAVRNPDFTEMTLEKENQVLLRFAIANGFRNIQNIVQKLKRNKCNYDYVEILACPSGCLNGGAQVRPTDGTDMKEIVMKLDNTYQHVHKRRPDENVIVDKLYHDWLDGSGSDKCCSFLHTTYHTVEKLNTPLNIKW